MKNCIRGITVLRNCCVPCMLAFVFTFIFACSDSDSKNENGWDTPYDPNIPVTLSTFYPDSGGMSTNVIIEGRNFGTDPKAIKVYYNKKEAAVVSAKGNMLYVITPRLPGDTCVISVVVGKDSLTFDNTFSYRSVTRVTTISGNPDRDVVENGTLISAAFQDPRFITIDAEDNIFVCEWSNQVLRRISLETSEVTTVKSGDFVGGSPNAPDVDSDGRVVIIPTDAGLTFYEFDPERLWDGKKFEIMRADDSKPFTCQWKHGVSSCKVDGMMYVRSYAGELIKFDPKSKKAWLVAENVYPGADGFGVFSPIQPNLLYLSYREGRHIGIYNVETDEYKTYTGYGQMGHQDGDIADAAFGNLQQICFDPEGNLFIADMSNHCIRKVSPDGVVSTVVGMPGKSGYKDGSPEEALFNNPSGVAVDSEGTIYIADRNNNCIRKLSIE